MKRPVSASRAEIVWSSICAQIPTGVPRSAIENASVSKPLTPGCGRR
jgi:hypothetical protein